MEFVPILAIGALTKKVVDLAKAVRDQDWNGAATLISVAVAGMLAVLIAAQTDWAETLDIGGRTLGELSFWSQLFVGASVASFGALFGYDIPMQLDSSVQTARRALFKDKTVETPDKLPAGKTIRPS